MTEQKTGQGAGAPEETEIMSLAEAFKFIGGLAQRAANGDESAGLMLDIINNEQLMEIQLLEAHLTLLQVSLVAKATAS